MEFRGIHWTEGMFLRPQHFQVADQCYSAELSLLGNTISNFNWGFKELKIELNSLENYRLVVTRIVARMPDGTIVIAPGDGIINVVDLKKAFETNNSVTVFLVIPHISSQRLSEDVPPRWRVESKEITDYNNGVDTETIEVRYLNFKLVLENEDMTGFCKIPLISVEKSSNAPGLPIISERIIPPLIAIDAWPYLKNEILGLIYDRVSRKLDLLSKQLSMVGLMATETGRFTFVQLQALGEAKTILKALVYTPGIHPFNLYMELCRTIGKIGFFTLDRIPPEIPPYDHDKLGATFTKLRIILEDLLNLVVEPEYKERPFTGAGLRMEVSLDPAWVEKGWQMFIGVQGSVSPDQLTQILTKPGFLDMKVASAQRVDMVFRSGRAGLRFISANKVPRILPSRFAFFQIHLEPTNEEWVDVCKTLSLAIRVNENRITSPLQNQKVMKIQLGSETITMNFTLFVVPERVLSVLEKTEIPLAP